MKIKKIPKEEMPEMSIHIGIHDIELVGDLEKRLDTINTLWEQVNRHRRTLFRMLDDEILRNKVENYKKEVGRQRSEIDDLKFAMMLNEVK